MPRSASMPSSASACGTVRGKPSRMKPLRAVRLRRCGRRSCAIRISSETSSPRLHHRLGLQPDLACPPRPRRAACRRSRAARCRSASSSRLACVPLPAPGGPSRISVHRRLRPCTPRPCVDQALILVREQVRLDLRHRVHRHRDDDQQAGAAEVERHAVVADQDFRQQADHRQIDRADRGQPGQHVVEILGRRACPAGCRG